MLECIFHYMWSGRGGDLHSEQQHWKQLSPCILINASSYLWIFNILTVKSGKSCGSQGSWSWSQQTEGEGSVASSAGYIILAKTGLREEQGVKGRAEVALLCLKKQ